VRTTRFWNNLYQVRSKSKDWKVKSFKSLWKQGMFTMWENSLKHRTISAWKENLRNHKKNKKQRIYTVRDNILSVRVVELNRIHMLFMLVKQSLHCLYIFLILIILCYDNHRKKDFELFVIVENNKGSILYMYILCDITRIMKL